MPLIGDFVDLIAPVAPSTPGADVFERFQAEGAQTATQGEGHAPKTI